MSEDGGYYIEFFQLGQQIKVTAIDPVSLVEVSIVAPTTATQAEMTRIAVEKLKRRITQLSKQGGDKTENPKKDQDGRGGVLV